MKTLIIGASTNPARYSYVAANRLKEKGFDFEMVGLREGVVAGQVIQTGTPHFNDIHTITLYVGPRHQPDYYDYFLSLKPKRIIFNPGTENPELLQLAQKNGIETEVACTLVMLSSGVYDQSAYSG